MNGASDRHQGDRATGHELDGGVAGVGVAAQDDVAVCWVDTTPEAALVTSEACRLALSATSGMSGVPWRVLFSIWQPIPSPGVVRSALSQ